MLQAIAAYAGLLAVAVFAIALSLTAIAYSGRAEHDAARWIKVSDEFADKYVSPDFRTADAAARDRWAEQLKAAPILWSNRYDTINNGPEYSVDILVGQDPGLPPPPGLPRWPRPGEAFLSPQLLQDGANENIAARYGTFAGTISTEGLSAVDERYAIVNPLPGTFPTSDLYPVESLGVPLEQPWWSLDLHAPTGETAVIFAAPFILATITLLLGIPALVLLLVARRVDQEARQHRRMVLRALGASNQHLWTVRLGEVGVPAATAAGTAVLLTVMLAFVPIRIPVTTYLLPTEWIRSALPALIGFTLLMMAIGVVLLLGGNARSANDSARPRTKPPAVPNWLATLSPIFGLAAAQLPNFVDPTRQAPWVLTYVICAAGAIVTLPLTIYILLRMFGAGIAKASVRRGSPAGLLISRIILAHPRSLVVTIAAIVVGAGLLAQTQFITNALQERTRQAISVQAQVAGRTLVASYMEGIAGLRQVTAGLPAGVHHTVITGDTNGGGSQINGSCADLTACALPCPTGTDATPLTQPVRGDLTFVGLSAPLEPGLIDLSTKPAPELSGTQTPQWLILHADQPMDQAALKAAIIPTSWPNIGPESPAWNFTGGAAANAEQGRWITVLGIIGMLMAIAALGVTALNDFSRQTRGLGVLSTYLRQPRTLTKITAGVVSLPLAAGGILAAVQSLTLVQTPIAAGMAKPFGVPLAVGISLASILIAVVCCVIGSTTLRTALARWRPGRTNL
ncbi:hypothetical protein [Intrasporangium sp.]|uniref:hypothetical protein n=1 Tax=Intrasporangium sp. TaxID=1925024 RepID=UPI003221B439